MSRLSDMMLTLLAILLSLGATSTLAEHQICNWDLKTRDPGIAAGWDTFCTAWPLPISAAVRWSKAMGRDCAAVTTDLPCP